MRLQQRRADLKRLSAIASATELALYFAIVGVALWLIVGADSPDNYKFFSLLFLPVVAAGVRHGIDGSCLSLALTQLGARGLLRRYGYDAGTFTEFQVIMLVLTMSGLLVGVVVSERAARALARAAAEAQIRDMQAEATRAARINMVSGMASALAHEINQPMTAARALARSVQQLCCAEPPTPSRANGNLATCGPDRSRRRRRAAHARFPAPRTAAFQHPPHAPVLDDALVLAARRPRPGNSIRLDSTTASP